VPLERSGAFPFSQAQRLFFAQARGHSRRRRQRCLNAPRASRALRFDSPAALGVDIGLLCSATAMRNHSIRRRALFALGVFAVTIAGEFGDDDINVL
jgi:hypothetical protein